MTSNIFFTADTHFGHKAMVERRGFLTTEEMDTCLINCWNRVVGNHDIIYHLGDLSFHKADKTLSILYQLNGQICMVKGNHDRFNSDMKQRFTWIKDYYELKQGSKTIVMCHYPFETWNKSHYGSWHLHGHSHGNLQTKSLGRMDVGVDTFGFFPYSMDDIVEHFQSHP